MNNLRREIEQHLRHMVFILMAAMYAVQAWACRGLYADGANFLRDLLVNQQLPVWDPQRFANHILTKGPVLLAIKLGLHDLVALRYLFSSWLLLCPLAVWAAALWSLRRDAAFWPFTALFSFVYFTTGFFIISEYNLCFALLAYCLALLVRPLPATPAARVGLLLAALFLPFHYPTTLFCGGLLFLMVLLKPPAEWGGVGRGYRALLAFLFLASVATAGWEVIAPRDPANFQTSRSASVFWHDMAFWCSLLFGLAAVASMYLRRKRLCGALAVIGAGLLVEYEVDPLRAYPFLHYAMRAYMSAAFAGAMLFLWWFRTRGQQWLKPEMPLQAAVMLTVQLTLFVLVDMNMSFDYQAFMRRYQAEVNSHYGVIPFTASLAANSHEAQRFMWLWNYSLMSVILRDGPDKAIITNPPWYQGYQPFDPYKDVPDLNGYYR